MQDNRDKLYNNLIATGKFREEELGSIEQFKTAVKDERSARKLYDNLIGIGKVGEEELGDQDAFYTSISPDFKIVTSSDDNKDDIVLKGEEKGFWDSYTGDLVERVGAGAARLQGGGLNLLEKASRYYNPTAAISKGQPNKFQQFLMKDVIAPIFYDEAERNKLEASPIMNYNHVPTAGKELKSYADTLSGRSDRYEGKDFMELWKDNKTSAIGELFLTASESLPQGVMASAGGAVSLPVIGAIAASDKYDKLSQDEATGDMSESAKLINSVLTGTGEAISEVGSVYIGKWLKPLYGKLGKQAAEEVAKNGFSRWMSGMFKKSGVFFAPVEEGIEEMASQLAENATDYITGATKELNLWDGVPESFAYGAAGGAQFSAAALPGLARRKIQRRGVNSDYKKSKSALESAFPGSDVAAFENGMSTMNPEEQVEILQGIVKNPDIQDEQKAVVADFVSKMNKRQLYNSPEAKSEDKVYGMMDGKVNKKSGDIVTAKDLEEKPVYVLDETDKGSLVEYENGEKKLIATSALQDINSEPVDEHVKKYLLNTFTQGELNKAKPLGNRIQAEQPSKFSLNNGDDVNYVDENGNSRKGVVVDASSDVEHVFLQDGTVVPIGNIIKHTETTMVNSPDLSVNKNDIGAENTQQNNQVTEKATEQPQTPISYEIEKDIIATQQPDGAFSINKEFTKADIEKGQKFVDRMNKDYEDEGMFFELAELPKVNSDNRFEKKRFGVVARERVQESPEQAQKPEEVQVQEPEEMQPEFSNEEEAVNWIADNSEDVGEILGTLNAVRQVKNPQANLQEWQRHLIGSKVKVSSYNQFGDRNNVTPTMRMKWFSKDGLPLDVIARDLSQYGQEVTEQDVVDFITSNPTNRVSNSTEEIERLERRFSEVATKASGMKIGRPGSPTGKLFIENVKNRESSEQLRQRIEDAQRAESEVLQSIAEQHEVEEREQEDVQPIGHGLFGNIYDQFKGKAKEAIRFLGNKKEGEAIGALHHPQVGDIDLVWGKEGSAQSDGFGLSKIARYHPEVLDNLQDIISDMVVVKASPNRISLESNTHKASVRLEWDGEKKTWLLTAFEKETPTSIDRTTDIGENLTDLQNDTAPLQNVSVSSIDKDIEITGENQGIDEDDVFDNAESTMVNETYSDTGEIDEDGVRFREINNEIEDIKNKTIAAGIFMKAPNGKPTNLTEKQWIQVRTKAFKKWFGDWEGRPKTASKVVDVNGEPLVVYHGSSKSFTEFNQRYMGANGTAIGQGFYFTSDKSFADGYSSDDGNVFEVFLNLRKELDSKNITIKKAKLKSILKEIDKVSSDEVAHSFLSNYNDVEYNGLERTLNEAVEMEMDAADSDVELIGGLVNGSGSLRGVYEVLEKTTGHDGILEKQKDGSVHFVVGRPNQIKSATDNTGSFSKDSDDIRYREGSPENVNERFNRELDSLTEESANGKVFHLGMPSKSLLSVGIPNKPFRLYGNKLLKKAKKHGFTPTDIKNLPHALENPIAVFNGNHRSSYAILTELEIRNNKVLVSVETNKDGEIDFNLVSSVFGKSSRSIVNWINSDKLRFSDKEKTLSYLSASALNADATNNSELSSATNIAQNFVNPTLLEGEISSAIDTLSDELGVKVNKVKDRKDLPEGIQRKMLGTRYPGLYDTKTGKVYVVLNEITDVGDAQATVLHEVLGHKGIRGLFGDKLSDFTDRVLMSMKDTDREKLINDYDGNQQLAAEEYIASFAEGYTDPSGWEKVKAIVKEFFREMGISLDISDNDLKYILWKAKNGLREGDGMMEIVKKISDDRSVQKTLFRKSRIKNNHVKDGSIDEHVADLKTSDLTKAKIGGTLKSFACKLNDAYIDNMSSVKKLQDDVEAEIGKPLPEYVNVYMFQNTVSSRNMRECEIFNDEYLKPITSIIKKLSKRGLHRRTLENYLIIKHGLEERNLYMNKKYETDGKDYSGLEAIKKETGIVDFASFIKNIEDRYDMNPLWIAINRATEVSLKKWYSSGMMTKENYAEVRGMYKHYIPLRGFDETTADDTYDYFTGSGSSFNNPLKEAKGRRSRADNPIAHIVSMAQSSIVGGNNNLMKLYFLRLAQMYPSAKLSVSREWLEQIGEKDGKPVYESVLPEYDDDIDIYQQNVKEFESRMKELESAGKAFLSKGKLDVGMHISSPHVNEHIVKMRLNGEDYAVYVHGDPLIAQSINGLNQVDEISKYWLAKGWDWVKRAMTANITTRSIAFTASNLKRDTRWATETLLVKEGAAYTKDFVLGIPGASGSLFRFLRGRVDLKNDTDKMLQEFLLNGGETGYTALHNIDKYKKMVKRMSGTSVLDRTHRGYMKFVDIFSSPNRWAEDLTRFSTYMASRKAGRSVLRSVYDAKEVTVNFNRKGSGKMGVNELKRIYFFFNAACQSMRNMGLMAKEHPYKTAALITERVAMGMLMPIITRAFWGMLGDDEEDVEEEYYGLPDHVRKNNSCYYLGKGRGFITMPLPIEDRAFYGMGDALIRYMSGRIDGNEASSDILSGLLDILPLNPVGGYSSIWPDVTRPLEEAYYTNQTFSGMPVTKTNPFNKYRPEFVRVYKSAGEIPVWVSEKLNKWTGGDIVKRGGFDKMMSKLSDKFGTNVNLSNPAAFEHVVEGYLGGMYKTSMQTGKSIGSAFDSARDVEVRGIPVLNRFYNAGGKYGEMQRMNEKYFDLIDEMSESGSWKNGYRSEARSQAGEPGMFEMTSSLGALAGDERFRKMREIGKIHKKVMKLYDFLNDAKTSAQEKNLRDQIFALKKRAIKSADVRNKSNVIE